MLVHTKKPHTKHRDMIQMHHGNAIYLFPRKIAEKYCLHNASQSVKAKEVFANINKQHTKPGALLRGIRARESLTQIAMAKKIKVTQSDISQMENGTRNIGRTIAKRIEKLFGVDYRSFLE